MNHKAPFVTIKTCPGLCCEKMGGISVTRSRGERIDEAIPLTLADMDAARGYEPWLGYMHDNMLQVVDIVDGWEQYTCRLYDRATARCSIYEQRPPMCRNFPYGRECEHCTYDSTRPDVPGILREIAFAQSAIVRSFE